MEKEFQDMKLADVGPFDIVIFHVGGVGGYGPAREVIDRFPRRTVIVCFEANPSPKDLLVQEKLNERGVRTSFVPKCIGIRRGKQKLYVNKHPESSSIFTAAHELRDWHVPYKGITTWGENCEVDRVVEVETTTLDDLIREGQLPSPDILSMDTQGSEMPIMRGGHHALADALSVVSEVDFVELYQGQELYAAQQSFLTERGFRLADIVNTQHWHPGPAAGKGFLVMGEALYLRDLKACKERFGKAGEEVLFSKFGKLAVTAYAFRRLSYSSLVIKTMREIFGNRVEEFFRSGSDLRPVYLAHQYMEDHHRSYLENNRYFYRNTWTENSDERWRRLRRHLARAKGDVLKVLRRPFRAKR